MRELDNFQACLKSLENHKGFCPKADCDIGFCSCILDNRLCDEPTDECLDYVEMWDIEIVEEEIEEE